MKGVLVFDGELGDMIDMQLEEPARKCRGKECKQTSAAISDFHPVADEMGSSLRSPNRFEN